MIDYAQWFSEEESLHAELSVDINADAIGNALAFNESLTSIRFTCFGTANSVRSIVNGIIPNTTLRSLTFFNVQGVKAQEIAELLIENKTLQSLSLLGSRIDVEGAQALAKALSQNHSLTSIEISGNKIDDDGAEAIVSALSVNNCCKSLDLSGNLIGDRGVKAIANALCVNGRVVVLNLSKNQIGDDGATSIANMLERNKHIKTIFLWRNHGIGDKGVRAIAQALEHNVNITSISLTGTCCMADGANAILQMMKTNKTIEAIQFDSIHQFHFPSPWTDFVADALRCNYAIIYADFNLPPFCGKGVQKVRDVFERNKLLQWKRQHAVLVDVCIAMRCIGLPAYVLLWIYDQFGPGQAATKQMLKITLIESVCDSIARLLECKK